MSTQVPENFVKPNFGLYEYPVETGIGTRTAKAYLLSKDAFTLLTMGYTGEKAMAFKIAYIARFNEMEEQLRTTSLQVAAHFGKNHKDVLRDIRVTIENAHRSLTSATLRPLSTRMPSEKESPRSLTGPGALRYQKVASSTDSVSAGASYLRKPQLTRR